MNTETSPVDHHARMIAALESKAAERVIELAVAKDECRRLSSELDDARLVAQAEATIGREAREQLAERERVIADIQALRASELAGAQRTQERLDEARAELEEIKRPPSEMVVEQLAEAYRMQEGCGVALHETMQQLAAVSKERDRVITALHFQAGCTKQALEEQERLVSELRALRERMEALAARWELDAGSMRCAMQGNPEALEDIAGELRAAVDVKSSAPNDVVCPYCEDTFVVSHACFVAGERVQDNEALTASTQPPADPDDVFGPTGILHNGRASAPATEAPAPTGGPALPDVARALELLRVIVDDCQKAQRRSLRAPTSEDMEMYTEPPEWVLVEDVASDARAAIEALAQPPAPSTPPAARDESVPPPGWEPYGSQVYRPDFCRPLPAAWRIYDAEHSAATPSLPPLPAGWTIEESGSVNGPQGIQIRPTTSGRGVMVWIEGAGQYIPNAVLQHHIARQDGTT